jgi:anti-sigma factor RsiW
MSDCPNVVMREHLPDLVNDRLAADARAKVEAHVASCAECRAELDLLRQVRAAAPSPRIDTARIAARIAPYRRPSALVLAARSWPVRAAAAIILVVGTTTIFQRDSATGPDTMLAIASPELAVGALTDISESDLRALADELGKLKAVTSTEPEVVVPSIGSGRGGGK